MTKTKTNRAKSSKSTDHFEENPVWPSSRIRNARPAREVSPEVVTAYETRRGRPPQGEQAKVHLSLRIDRNVLNTYRATGEGWQSRMAEALARGAKRLEKH